MTSHTTHRRARLAGGLNEFRAAARSLRRSPGFAMVAVLSIALAIGAGVSGFTVVDAVRLRALPFPEARRLVVLGEAAQGPAGAAQECRASCTVQYETYARVLRDAQLRTVDAIIAYTPGLKALTLDGDAIQVTGGVVSPNVFTLLGARALHGRPLLPSDDELGAPLVTVLGYSLWASRFGADPGVIGRTVRLSDSQYTIVGVMEPGFDFEAGSLFWLPVVPTLDPSTRPSITSVSVFARLAPGRTIDQLRTELATLEPVQTGTGGRPAPERMLVADPLRMRYTQAAQSSDVAFAAVVLCILLIASANVANLVLARALHHQREFALRAALGAGQARLAIPVFIQNALIIAAGTALGIALAASALGVLRSAPVLNGLRPTALDYRLDMRAVAFAIAAAFVAWTAISALPARLARAGNAQDFLRASAGTSRRGRGLARHGFIVAQIACATVLMVGASLMVRSVREISRVDPGFEPADVLVLGASYPHPWRVDSIYVPVTERILREIGTLPDVAAAALRMTLPMASGNDGLAIVPEGGEALSGGLVPNAVQSVSPDYFDVLGIPIRAGRAFTEQDRASSVAVAIINEWAAERWWPGESAVGRTLRVENPGGPALTLTITGVVADNRAAQPGLLFAQEGPELYRPWTQASNPFPTFFARAHGHVEALVTPARALLVRSVPDRPIFTTPAQQNVDQQTAGVRRNALHITSFAVIGLLLALIGVYGVLSFDVNRRTRELGIRSALGATTPGIARLVLGSALRLAAAGIVVGVPAALAATRLMQALLFRTSLTDPLTYLIVVVCILGVALGAAYLPARRAARVSPLVALRTD